jgi:molybdenum cofactor sulfurtransferase
MTAALSHVVPYERLIDELRATEYRRLDQLGHAYLDYTGGALFAESQLHAHHDLLARSVFGNPHSGNPASHAATSLIEHTRCVVLEYFRASPDEYVVIFTPNATGALKLLGESFAFAPGARYVLSADNHNSVNGIREFARRRGAQVCYAPIVGPELRLDGGRLRQLLEKPRAAPGLFAFPAQSNFSGVQHPLEWIEAAHRYGWQVLLDAAAFVPTNRLDLSRWHPDFVSLSFYKMFGYPTGVGALIARKQALQGLRRPWFAGGTITFSSVSAATADVAAYYLTPGAAGFEDGTVNYLNIPAVEIGLRWLEHIGLDVIHARVTALTEWLLHELQRLQHANGQPLVRVYGPHNMVDRGGTIALNFIDPGGKQWDCWHIERLANERMLSLRAGCHCNPGAREVALGYAQSRLTACFEDQEQLSFDEFLRTVQPHIEGVVRVSLGLPSTLRDAERFVEFAASFADRPSAA